MTKHLGTTLLLMLLSTACAKVVVVPVKGGTDLPKLREEGLFYALPKTVLRVQVKVDRTEKTDAPYSEFAKIFAPGSDLVCKVDECKAIGPNGEKTATLFTVKEGTFSTFGEPDPDHIYLVKFVGRGAIDQALTMTWSETGLLSAATASVTNRTTDVALSGIKLVAGLGTKATFGATTTAIGDIKVCPEEAAPDIWVLPILQADSESKATLVSNYCEMSVKERETITHDKETLLRRATRAYNARVAPLVNARTKLVKGESQALDPLPLVNKLETLIGQQLQALYLGTSKTDTWDGSLHVRDLTSDAAQNILGITPDKGVCPINGLLAPDGKALPKNFTTTDCGTAKPVTITLRYHPDEGQQIFKTVKDRVELPSEDRSFRYRLPAQVSAALVYDQKVLGGGVLSVAQLGHIVSLPANRHSKALSYDLAMIESTGGLKSFKLGSTGGLDTATIDALSTAGGTVLDARNAARKAEQTAEDELTILTREQMLLKLRDEICTIRKKYGLDCEFQP